MGDLTRQIKLGDITFGAPADVELLHTPWGYYSFLGISPLASKEEIEKAYKKLAKELHPDKTKGDSKPFQTLEHVTSILLDDGGELGQEHSRRRHYNEVCALDSFFDGFIDYNRDRTKKFSEVILRRLEIGKKCAENESEISKRFPEFSELKRRLTSDIPEIEKEKIAKKLQKMAFETRGLTKEAQSEIKKSIKEHMKREEKEKEKFLDSFKAHKEDYFRKVLDVFYIGGKGIGSNFVEFVKNRLFFGFVDYDERENVLEMVLAGMCYISGFSQVHFKSEEAHVTVRDPNVEGIFHVGKGDVNLIYDSSTYGSVIRARAPKVWKFGFVQEGDLFIPERFAVKGWTEKKPSLDVAVSDGFVSLQLKSPDIISRKKFYSYDIENLFSDLNNINNNYIKKNIKKY